MSIVLYCIILYDIILYYIIKLSSNILESANLKSQ